MNKRARRALARIKAIYQTIPNANCKGLCVEFCGPIAMTMTEWRRLRELTGARPTIDTHGACSLLKDGRCTQYQDRPAICRLFGAVETMRCPYGCEPDRMLTRQESSDILEHAVAADPNGAMLASDIASETPDGVQAALAAQAGERLKRLFA